MASCSTPKPAFDPKNPGYQVAGDPESGWSTGSSSSSADEAIGTSGAVKTFTFDEISILCDDIGLSPEMIEGVLAQLTTQHFSSADQITFPELRSLVWVAPPNPATKIQILPLNSWSEVAAGKLPAILYADLGQQSSRIAIGDQHYQTTPDAEGFARAMTGAHKFMCLGENDFQASQLATELTRFFTEFAPQLVRRLPFHDLQVVSRDPPQAFTSLGARIGVAFTLTYSYIWTWELTPSGPPLKTLSLKIQ